MRPAKFFFALLFGAAVLITFLKLLFFAIGAAAVLGTLFFAARGVRSSVAGRGDFYPSRFAHGSYPTVQLGGFSDAQPIDPRTFQFVEKQQVGRQIEVL